MAELLPPDAAERAQALDITQSWIVEAPAGSGKTGLLIQRYLKLLASETVTDPGQVLAITFTRKATAEMQERVLAQLTAARDGLPAEKSFDRETRPFALAVLARDAALDWNLIDSPRCLRIRTIDSVAAEIARGLPILSGSGGGQSPAEDAGPLHAEAAHRTLMQLGGQQNDQASTLSAALETLLLHRDGSLTDCESLIARMLGTRDQWGELVPLAAHHLTDEHLETVVLPKLERALDRAICRALTRLTQVMPPLLMNRLCALAAQMGHLEGYEGNESPIALCAGRSMPPQEKAAHLDHWRALIHLLLKADNDFRSPTPNGLNKKNLAFLIEKDHRAELIAILQSLAGETEVHEALCSIRALPPAHYPPEQWHVTKALFRVLSRALVELQFVFAARAQCDFAELGLLARTALRRDSALDDLRTAAGMSLQHLLVDEMQDTSSAQYELIQLLTQRWDGHSQTVFLVGDPKQSIYLFRQARVERFVRTQHLARLGDVPLGTLHLTANFRSQAPLVQAFNEDFAQIFPPPQPSSGYPIITERSEGYRGRTPSPTPVSTETVPFRQAHPMRPPTPGTPGLDSESWEAAPKLSTPARVWHAESLPYADTSEERTTLRITKSREQAAEVRTIAETWRTAHPQATIAVLVRNRTHLLDIIKSFKSLPNPIPYRAVEIEPLAERQEILDLLALTRALLHPADRTAWLALLGAPWCGLALADLHILAGQDDPTLAATNLIDLIHLRGDLLSSDGIARLEPFWSVMQAALHHRGTLSLTQLVERTWQAFAAPVVLPPEALANANRYFELLEALEDQPGPLHLEPLADQLAKLYAAPATHPGAVDLMTIHKSKGLEWDVVFVPALERTGRVNTGQLLAWLEIDAGEAEDVAHGILAPIQAKGTASHQLTAWMRSIESARESAERKRLFYVACTRAREQLHLFAAPALNAKGELKPKPDSLLQAAWPAAEPHIQSPPKATILTFPTPAVLDTLAAGAVIPFATKSGAPGLDSETWVPKAATPSNGVDTLNGVPHDHQAEGEVIVGSGTTPRVIQRIPLHLLPTQTTHPQIPIPPPAFTRPEGSFAARTFGNATHAFLDQLATHLAQGQSPASLLTELPTWTNRITAILRSSGLAATHLQRQTATLLRALTNALTDPEGRWILSPHPEARSESSLTSPAGTLRLDRTFLAGPTPGSQGTTHLWIVDYKTATHAHTGLEPFLAKEKVKYQPQLETYAQALAHQGLPIRLALYYPLLPHFLWWEAR